MLVFALVGNVLSPSSVTAAEGDNLKLSYGIYVAGTRVFKISYSASLTSEGYRTAVAMGPRGIGKAFADFKLKMAAAGLFSNGQPKPVDLSMQ